MLCLMFIVYFVLGSVDLVDMNLFPLYIFYQDYLFIIGMLSVLSLEKSIINNTLLNVSKTT